MHRQDRHADDGRSHPGEVLRRRAARETTACSRWRTSTATSRPASRTSSTARYSRTKRPTRTPAFPSSRRSTRSRSTSSGESCRSSSARPRATTASSQRVLPRRSFRTLHELQARRAAPARWTTLTSSELKKEYEHLSADGFRVLAHRHQGRPAARHRCRQRHSLRQDGRMRPDPRGLRRVPRSAEGERHGGDRGARAPRRRGQGHHGRQRAGGLQGLQGGRPGHRSRPPGRRRREDDRRGARRRRREDDALRPRLPGTQAADHQGAQVARTTRSASWATASTTRPPSTPPTSASASTRPWTSRRSRRT